MKRLNKLSRRSVSALFAVLTFMVLFGAATAARAQNVQPFVDCVEAERDGNGVLTGKYTAYFSYNNLGATAVYIPTGTGGNIFTPIRNPPGQPDTFQPGIHSRVVTVAGIDLKAVETWHLTLYTVSSSFTQNQLCGDSRNARLTTYQGKLNDGGAAASGTYDLQFQLFDALTGGTARTTPISLENVTVTNGVFTVQLDLGANSIGSSGSSNQAINPLILAGEDAFLEIGVRPGTSSGAFTILSPRQPLTAVPLAMRANTANEAVRATTAVNAANAANADNATNATNLKGTGGTVYLPLTTGAPPASECNYSDYYGRMKVDAGVNGRIWICTAAGWKSTVLQ